MLQTHGTILLTRLKNPISNLPSFLPGQIKLFVTATAFIRTTGGKVNPSSIPKAARSAYPVVSKSVYFREFG